MPRECPCCRDLDADVIAFHRRNKTVDRIAPDKIRQRELTHVDRIIVDGVRKHGLGFWRVQFGQLFTGRQTHILILPGDRVGQPLNAFGLIGVFGFLLQILECFGANRKLRIVQHLANQNAGPRLLLFGNDFVQHVAANIFVNAAECKSQCRIVAAVILCVQCELESLAANGLRIVERLSQKFSDVRIFEIRFRFIGESNQLFKATHSNVFVLNRHRLRGRVERHVGLSTNFPKRRECRVANLGFFVFEHRTKSIGCSLVTESFKRATSFKPNVGVVFATELQQQTEGSRIFQQRQTAGSRKTGINGS